MRNPSNKLAKLLAYTVTAATLAFASTAYAETYPSKPITIVVPFAPGGTTDILARAVGQELSKSIGQPVIIDNKPGAGGNIGSQFVSRSSADGYTLLMGTVGTHGGINTALYSKPGYDHIKDFAPVTQVAAVPNVVVVNTAFAEKNKIGDVRALANYAKANPEKLNMGSAGNGTSIHLSGELFRVHTKITMTHIPYKGSAPAIADLIGGQVDVMFDNLPSAMPHIKNGRLRALAVTADKRWSSLPQVPTVAETGGDLTGYEAMSWFGIFAPANTPKEVVGKLHKEIAQALSTPGMKEKLVAQGATPVGSKPEQFAEYIRAETNKWGKVVKESGAKVD